ncbi:MAG: ATP-binding cassette domain-containing protein [Microbacteriaceae bacterium]|nr:ATP-binding cassette domain-containing protein [Microbacteriaceae bacterium]MCI1206855.1 ATP-binding cassette domain-containing protein [Microbacteriaceae bacterium]
MITVEHLTKRYRSQLAVDDVSFVAPDGQVTGFVGPNGAGKSTTMRVIVSLHRPSSGTCLIDGRPFVQLDAPMTHVGVLLDAGNVHPGRTARQHLNALAATHGLPRTRVDEVLDLVGLAGVARRRLRGFSLGMSQRLGVAVALLGNPRNLILDEPINGLDPEGVVWMRDLLHFLAGQGRAVLVSSHLLGEMAHTADRIVAIGRGRLLADAPMAELLERISEPWVQVRTPAPEAFRDALAGVSGARVEPGEDGALVVRGASAAQVGECAAAGGVALHELVPRALSLEDAFLRLTHDSVAYRQRPVDTSAVPTEETSA